MRYSASGDAIASFSIACTENWKDKNGQKQERTEWVRISAFGKLAEICGEYLKKGSSVFISGRMQTREWDDKEGNKRYTTEIVADTMKMLGARSAAPDAQQPSVNEAKPNEQKSGFDDFSDDIPFANPYRGRACYVV
jgi:single-strand DNA-binding protein